MFFLFFVIIFVASSVQLFCYSDYFLNEKLRPVSSRHGSGAGGGYRLLLPFVSGFFVVILGKSYLNDYKDKKLERNKARREGDGK